MNTTFNFETREQYIAWRAEWREDYKTTCIAIRAAKTALKQANRDGNWSALSQAHWALIKLRQQAGELLSTRAESKIAAAEARARRLEKERDETAELMI